MNYFKRLFKNKFARDLTLYTVCSVLLSLVGTAFRVWISNKVGAEGMGLYSLVYSVYLPACTLAVSSVNLASTRLVTEALAKNKCGSVGSVMRRCFLYSAFFGILACALLWFFAEPIAVYWIKNASAVFPLRVICFGLPCLSLASGLHGAFTALRKISRSIVVQITEDFTKIAVTFSLITYFTGAPGVEWGVVALVAGSAAGETLSCGVAFILWLTEKRGKKTESAPGISKKLLSISLPSAFSAYARSGLSMFESLMVPAGFRRFGMSDTEALSVLGMFKSMVLPVIYFPATLIGSFSRLIVPEMAEAYEKNDIKRIESVAVRSIKATLVFSVFVMFIFLFFAEALGNELYSSREASAYIRLLAPLVPFMYLDSVVDSLLKGLNGQLASMRINIVDSLCRVALVCFLLPKTGFDGYLIVTYVSTLLNGSLSINRFLRISKVRIPLGDCLFFPLLASLTAVILPFTIMSVSGVSFSVFVWIIMSSALYVLILFSDKLVTFPKKLLTQKRVRDKIKVNI